MVNGSGLGTESRSVRFLGRPRPVSSHYSSTRTYSVRLRSPRWMGGPTDHLGRPTGDGWGGDGGWSPRSNLGPSSTTESDGSLPRPPSDPVKLSPCSTHPTVLRDLDPEPLPPRPGYPPGTRTPPNDPSSCPRLTLQPNQGRGVFALSTRISRLTGPSDWTPCVVGAWVCGPSTPVPRVHWDDPFRRR